jgi:hypothetical protein
MVHYGGSLGGAPPASKVKELASLLRPDPHLLAEVSRLFADLHRNGWRPRSSWSWFVTVVRNRLGEKQA